MCVTYVSSASFLSRAIDKFKNVKVIIGIEKEDVRKAIAESINARVMQEGTKFFEELPDTGKEKLLERSLEIRYSKQSISYIQNYIYYQIQKVERTV